MLLTNVAPINLIKKTVRSKKTNSAMLQDAKSTYENYFDFYTMAKNNP